MAVVLPLPLCPATMMLNVTLFGRTFRRPITRAADVTSLQEPSSKPQGVFESNTRNTLVRKLCGSLSARLEAAADMSTTMARRRVELQSSKAWISFEPHVKQAIDHQRRVDAKPMLIQNS